MYIHIYLDLETREVVLTLTSPSPKLADRSTPKFLSHVMRCHGLPKLFAQGIKQLSVDLHYATIFIVLLMAS